MIKPDTKLYDIPKGSLLFGFQDKRGHDVTIVFGHLDGAYSYCYFENDHSKVVHLSASTPLKKVKDGYKVADVKDE